MRTLVNKPMREKWKNIGDEFWDLLPTALTIMTCEAAPWAAVSKLDDQSGLNTNINRIEKEE